ncbi:hypothetical protein JHK85_000959 [Glycine max]|nr:hypothetical protein JHK85_000959 [Glycine max]KAG5088314.1 hypothetical protein JHK86_000926 [Glycine max]
MATATTITIVVITAITTIDVDSGGGGNDNDNGHGDRGGSSNNHDGGCNGVTSRRETNVQHALNMDIFHFMSCLANKCVFMGEHDRMENVVRQTIHALSENYPKEIRTKE